MTDNLLHNEDQVSRLSGIDVIESALSRVGEITVRRALLRRRRRMVGPWCFIDHMGPATVDEEVRMWWNYVARTREEIVIAHREWTDDSGRFGHVESRLPRTLVDPPPWKTQ